MWSKQECGCWCCCFLCSFKNMRLISLTVHHTLSKRIQRLYHIVPIQFPSDHPFALFVYRVMYRSIKNRNQYQNWQYVYIYFLEFKVTIIGCSLVPWQNQLNPIYIKIYIYNKINDTNGWLKPQGYTSLYSRPELNQYWGVYVSWKLQ